MRLDPPSRRRYQNLLRIPRRFRPISSAAGSGGEQRTEEESAPVSPEGEIRRVRDLPYRVLRRRRAPCFAAVWSRIPLVMH
ncbi:hypothetical protein F2Q70_00020236 [Brassica cretica]|uniref:Uncharacterized protein n=1 Tax=Brassica cretica TaxID=69181 RepID=A0A8S9GXQ3_BRACR|nr:hypothetical protein F2Q70_00020236 [Brassica cretica]